MERDPSESSRSSDNSGSKQKQQITVPAAPRTTRSPRFVPGVVVAPLVRLDRTLTLRKVLSRDYSVTEDKNDVLSPVLSADDALSSLIRAPPCGTVISTQHQQHQLDKTRATTIPLSTTLDTNDTPSSRLTKASYAEGFDNLKKKLRSKVLKSKVASMHNNGGSAASSSKAGRGGGDSSTIATDDESRKKKGMTFLQRKPSPLVQSLQKNPSRVLSIMSETSTSKTPKMTNKASAVKRTFSSVDEELSSSNNDNDETATAMDDDRPSQRRTNNKDRLCESLAIDMSSIASNSVVLMSSTATDPTGNSSSSVKESRQDDNSKRSGDDSSDQDVSAYQEESMQQGGDEAEDEETTTRCTARTNESTSTTMPGISFLFMELFNCKSDDQHTIDKLYTNENFSLATGEDDASFSTMGFHGGSAMDYGCCCADLCLRRSSNSTRMAKELATPH
jgi:hypothetical protein